MGKYTKHNIWKRILFGVAITILAYTALVVIGNRSYRNITIEKLSDDAVASLSNNSLTVTTWNLGYGGLGAESDFVADGGTHILPPSRAIVEKNIQGIVAELNKNRADILIMQEVARPGLVTHGGDVLGNVHQSLSTSDNAFSPDFTMRFMPPGFGAQHGLFSSTKIMGATREVVNLPLEPGYIFGLSRRLYHLHITRIPFERGEWSIINAHLSAFDDGANIRMEQLRSVLSIAQAEYENGRHVIIGGDWNLELARPDRPSTTLEKDLFWLFPFPTETLQDGWQIAADQKTPSVRTNERPYIRNENFTTTIDGFVVSPNVAVESIKTTDFDFAYTDHQPVTATFRAKTP